MIERAIDSPAHQAIDKLSSASQMDPHANTAEFSPEVIVDHGGAELTQALNALRPLHDTEITQAEITVIVDTWNPSRVFRGKQNSEKPRQVIQWMLEQTSTTFDVREDKTQGYALYERDRRIAQGLPATRDQKKLDDLTPNQVQRLELAKQIDIKVDAAQKKVDEEAQSGTSKLIEYIEDLEGYVMIKYSNANIVRLFNQVDDKTGGSDQNLIIAKRTLVVMLSNEINDNPTQ